MANADFSQKQNSTSGGFDAGSYREKASPEQAVQLTPLQQKLAGLEAKLPAALTRFLEDHSHVKTLYLHLDNDGPGRLAAKAILAAIPEGYEVKNRPPPQGKDVNDFLCHRLGIPIRSAKGKELER